MFRRIVEYVASGKETKPERPINPTGLKTYRFCAQEEVLGVPCGGRWVCVVENEKAFAFFEARPNLFQPALDLEAKLHARELVATLTDPFIAEAFASALENMGFVRQPMGMEGTDDKRRRRKAVEA